MSLALSHLELAVSNPHATAAYLESLGFFTIAETGNTVYVSPTPCYGNIEGLGSTCIILHKADSAPNATATSCYWKVGLTTPNLDSFVELLKSKDVTATEPHTFEDIGYLCHLKDPDGLSIELLQETFENHKTTTQHTCITFAHITMRVSDIEPNLRFYRDLLGMKLLSRQDVPGYGFCLYFLAFTDDCPPESDINSVTNREWLWQRKYTILELQHKSTADKFAPGYGLNGIRIKSSNLRNTEIHLRDNNYNFEVVAHEGMPSFTVQDPNGVPVYFDQLAL